MATRYHWLRLRTVAHPTEEPGRVAAALRFVAGSEVPLKDEALETHHGGTQHVLEAVLDKSRALRDVLDRVFALPGALAKLRAEVERRVDDDGVLYMRVDKQEACAGRLVLTEGEDCVQLRVKLEVHPATREGAVAGFVALLERGKA